MRATIPWIAAALVAVTLIAFAPVLENRFTNFDDDVYVTANRQIQQGLGGDTIRWAFTTTRAANWHPLTWIAHAAHWSLFGGDPRGHHAAGVMLHATSAVILFLLLGSATRAWWPSALAAALFAVHPLRVESVAWAAELKDVLSMTLALLATAAYVRYARAPSAGRLIPVIALMALALMAKPMPVTLPFVFLVLDFWPLERRERWRALVLEKLPLFALAAASAVVTYWAQQAGGAVASIDRFPLVVRVANAFWSTAMYLFKTIWPTSLAVYYPHPGASVLSWRAAAGLTVVVAATAAAWYLRRRRPYVIAGWLWFVGTLVPMIGLVQIGGQGMADRYTYLPSIGLAFAAAWAAAEAGKRAVAPALVVIVTLAVLTRAQVGVWRDSVSLFTHAIRVAGPSATAEVDLGDALEAQGKVADAMNAFEAAARLEPGHRAAENRIAGILSRQGRLEEAEAHYRAVLARLPSDPETLGNLGIVLAKQRRLDEAMTAFRAALAGDHQEPADVHTNLGNALLLSGRVEEAIAEYRESLRLAPGDRETEANLKVALERLNR